MKQLLLRNCAVDFVEICNVYVRKMMIKATKRIFNSDKICRSYSDLNFGVTFLEHVYTLFRIKCSEQRNIANEKKHTKYNVNRHAHMQ